MNERAIANISHALVNQLIAFNPAKNETWMEKVLAPMPLEARGQYIQTLATAPKLPDALAGNGHHTAQDAPAAPPLDACPALPQGAALFTDLGHGAGAWIDTYITHARAISPMTPDLFHEGAALWLASLAVARRLVLNMPHGPVYPSLFILWSASSTLYRKSTAMAVAGNLAREVFPCLLGAQESTPEALFADMAGQEPSNLASFSPQSLEAWKAERNFAAQHGMMRDEISKLLADANRDYNAGQIETILGLYDCNTEHTRSTRAQGRLVIRNAYFSLFGASTPDALAKYLNDAGLWGNGFWPRFAILTPESERPEWSEPTGGDPSPELAQGLRRLFERLPVPQWPEPPRSFSVSMAPDALAAWNRYNKALSYDLITETLDQRLHASYGRLPTHALKVAILLAALDWPDNEGGPEIEMCHLARAIDIVERWRASLHRSLERAVVSDFHRKAERVKTAINRYPQGASARDIAHDTKLRSREVEELFAELLTLGEIEEATQEPNPKGGRPTTRYILSA